MFRPRSLELLAESGELLLDFEEFLPQAGYFFFQSGYTIGSRVCAGIGGQECPPHIRCLISGECWRIAGEQVHIARFFGAGLAREDCG